MIRIERGKEIKPGVFEYKAEDHARGIKIDGRSRQPLLDGCRQIKSILKDTRGVRAAVFNRFARDGKIHKRMCLVWLTGVRIIQSLNGQK